VSGKKAFIALTVTALGVSAIFLRRLERIISTIAEKEAGP
jgi:hypothetical protein